VQRATRLVQIPRIRATTYEKGAQTTVQQRQRFRKLIRVIIESIKAPKNCWSAVDIPPTTSTEKPLPHRVIRSPKAMHSVPRGRQLNIDSTEPRSTKKCPKRSPIPPTRKFGLPPRIPKRV